MVNTELLKVMETLPEIQILATREALPVGFPATPMPLGGSEDPASQGPENCSENSKNYK